VRFSAIICVAIGFASQLPGDEPWSSDFFDPAERSYGGADLILPMPCGGAIAFQRVEVPIVPGDPLSDALITLGSSDVPDFIDYKRNTWLRGGFLSEDGRSSVYFIGRYEVTIAQYEAVIYGRCGKTGREARIPKGNTSWFDAIDFTRRYSSWIRKEHPERMPATADGSAYFRLPTEVEWEYAARGGADVPRDVFRSRTSFLNLDIDDYAVVRSTSSSRDRARPIAQLEPNPLGIFDMYGNLEELILEPFQANAGGRPHGQAGGILTKGGWYGSDPALVSSAGRTEYPMFEHGTGDDLRLASFGFRIVVAASAVQSDDNAKRMAESFDRILTTKPTPRYDLKRQLVAAEQIETNERLKQLLGAVRKEIEGDGSNTASVMGQEVITVALENAAALLSSIRTDAASIPDAQATVDRLRGYMLYDSDAETKALFEPRLRRAQEELSERISRLFVALSTYRNTLKFLSEVDEDQLAVVQAAFQSRPITWIHEEIISEVAQSVEEDITGYRNHPGMSADEFLALAEM